MGALSGFVRPLAWGGHLAVRHNLLTQCHEAASIFTGYFDTVGISHSDVPRVTTRESVSRAGG